MSHFPGMSYAGGHDAPSRTATLGLVLAILLSPGSVSAQSSLGPLAPYIEPSQDDVWTVDVDDSAVLMSNSVDPAAISYYYVTSPAAAEGKRFVAVDIVFVEATPDSFAGLLYGYIEAPRSYFLFTAGGDRSINLHSMSDGRFELLLKTEGFDASAKALRLGIREQGDIIALLVDGKQVAEFGNDRIGQGDTGIVSTGTGRYLFSNFELVNPEAVPPGSTLAPQVNPLAEQPAVRRNPLAAPRLTTQKGSTPTSPSTTQ